MAARLGSHPNLEMLLPAPAPRPADRHTGRIPGPACGAANGAPDVRGTESTSHFLPSSHTRSDGRCGVRSCADFLCVTYIGEDLGTFAPPVVFPIRDGARGDFLDGANIGHFPRQTSDHGFGEGDGECP